ADAAGLVALDAAKLARGFQVDTDNPLIGLDLRLELLRRLGRALAAQPELFGTAGRPGHLVDDFARRCRDGRVPATLVLTALLESLSSIWPSGLLVDGFNVGDAGRHPAAETNDVTSAIVPFHKLSQWLTYSLFEPLTEFGLSIIDVGGLTALAEYRNG